MNDFIELYRRDVENKAKDIIKDIISLAASLSYEEDVFLDDVCREVKKLNTSRKEDQNELSENNIL